MAKYTPLASYLAGQAGSRVHLSFSEIEEIIGDSLPASASKYDEWWRAATPHRPQESAWLKAGWRVVGIDRTKRNVIFGRA
jgi:hypothetical protein